jgi:hypothetical protein
MAVEMAANLAQTTLVKKFGGSERYQNAARDTDF